MSEKDGSSKVKGALFTLASGAVTAFCWAQYMRAGKDERKIKELFQYRTTIKDLEMMLAKGKTLPKIAIICGQLDADEPMGSNGDIAIQQHLLTRLAPSIALGRNSRLTRGATEGDRPIRRTPKDVRYTVATARLDAEGLHLRGTQGGEADIHLPEMITEMGHNSPCLFLSQADALQEFMSTDDWKEQLTAKEKDDLSKTPLAETGKRFTHLSKFVSDDKEPKGDIPMQFLRDCHSKLAYLEHHDEKQGYFSVFQQDKTSWFWNPVGFYDYSAQETNIPTWCSLKSETHEFLSIPQSMRSAD